MDFSNQRNPNFSAQLKRRSWSLCAITWSRQWSPLHHTQYHWETSSHLRRTFEAISCVSSQVTTPMPRVTGALSVSWRTPSLRRLALFCWPLSLWLTWYMPWMWQKWRRHVECAAGRGGSTRYRVALAAANHHRWHWEPQMNIKNKGPCRWIPETYDVCIANL